MTRGVPGVGRGDQARTGPGMTRGGGTCGLGASVGRGGQTRTGQGMTRGVTSVG